MMMRTIFSEIYRIGCNRGPIVEQVRYIKKHYHPKWKKERAAKVIKMDLPDFQKLKADRKLSPEEMRSKLKREGVAPPRPWIEKPLLISATGDLIDPYIPPEGDGKLSIVSFPGAKQRMERLEKKGKSMLAVRKIRQFEEDFNLKIFASKAQDIYIEAHTALASKDNDKLHDLVTEKCFPEMVNGIRNKTIRWKFIESIEPATVVHVRQTDLISKDNIFAQITVRLHTKQIMAVYDRFGRLMIGSELVAKDVLEYVAFEKHLSNLYGQWRMHGKIIPDWLVTEDSYARTFVRKPQETTSSLSEEK